VWSFELRSPAEHTRLISRNRFDTSALALRDKLAYPVVEPGLWVTERKMLLTITRGACPQSRLVTVSPIMPGGPRNTSPPEGCAPRRICWAPRVAEHAVRINSGANGPLTGDFGPLRSRA
jgi:hypothetical protein